MSRVALRSWRLEGSTVVPHRGGVPLSDRGFRYGEHLFESLAVRDGNVLLAGEHLDNLCVAVSSAGWPFPRTIRTAFRSFCAKTRLPDGMLRIYLTAGAGAPGAPVTKSECYLTWEHTPFPSEKDLVRGIALVSLKHPVAREGWGVKSGNYLTHLEALRRARAAGADEGIVFDDKGRAVSCAMGNLLVWLPSGKGLSLCTPSSGARPGAVLSWVRQNAIVKDRSLGAADLRRAVAIAVTNSRIGVMPVASLEGKPVSDPTPALKLAFSYLRSHGLFRGA